MVVITSYSIHYTKLYDFHQQRSADRERELHARRDPVDGQPPLAQRPQVVDPGGEGGMSESAPVQYGTASLSASIQVRLVEFVLV